MVADEWTVGSLPRRWLWRLVVPGLLAGLTIVTGTVGTYQHLATTDEFAELSTAERILEAVNLSLTYFALGTGPFPDSSVPPLALVARYTGAIFVFYAAILGISLLLASRLRPVEIELRYRLARHLGSPMEAAGHTVVCGLDETGRTIAAERAGAGDRVVAIAPEAAPGTIRELRAAGVIVFRGSPTEQVVLRRRARIRRATEVYVTGEDDATNMATVQAIRQALAAQTRELPVQCYVHLTENEHRQHLHDTVDDTPTVEVHSYDHPTATAREFLQRVPVGRFEGTAAATVGVVLVGWTPRSKALLRELCFQMHYLDADERRVVVVTANPEAAETEFHESQPAVDPEWWTDQETARYVEELFPTIEFERPPASLPRLFDRTGPVAETLAGADCLTVVIDELDGVQAGSVAATVYPRLVAWVTETAIDPDVYYFTPKPETTLTVDVDPTVPIDSFTHFFDGKRTRAIQGTDRDRLAKHLAIVYYLLYEYEPAATEQSPTGAVLSGAGLPALDDVDAIHSEWTALPDAVRERAVQRHWRGLAEPYRDSNRRAADHVAVKRRLETRLDADEATIVELLGEVEHRRWAAERFLEGWEPLPRDDWNRWQDPEDRARLKSQRYHRDLYPLDEIPVEGKDETQVAFARSVSTWE